MVLLWSRPFRSLLPLILVSLCLFLVAGCNNSEEKSPAKSSSKITIRIGLIPEHNLFAQKKRYAPLASYLSRKCGINVELNILSCYGNIIDNFVSNDLDGAFFGSFTGALALKKLQVEALARPENPEGISTYYGLIFVRKDSGITTAADMKGKRFAFVDKATTAGWLLPLHFFIEQGIADYKTWFKETYFTGTHEDAVLDVLHKKADIGAAKNTVFDRLKNSDHTISQDLVILATSPPVPANSLLVRKDLDNGIKKKLKESLLQMDADLEGQIILQNFGAARFIETTKEDYLSVFEFAEHIGLDLTAYYYIND